MHMPWAQWHYLVRGCSEPVSVPLSSRLNDRSDATVTSGIQNGAQCGAAIIAGGGFCYSSLQQHCKVGGREGRAAFMLRTKTPSSQHVRLLERECRLFFLKPPIVM